MGALPRPDLPPGPLRALFDALHAEHHRAGWPSLREMAKECGCSHTTVSAAFSEPRLPRWGLLELIVETLGGDTERFRALWLAVNAAAPGPLTAVTTATGAATGAAPVRQLPAEVAGFTGRGTELAALDRLLDAASSALPIAVVSGTAGVGKTALAVHWAHRVADRFPDGQLYQDLRGYDRDSPADPHEALDVFLRALGLEGAAIPPKGPARAARFRSLLAGRRMLLVLDNAHSVDQVRDLLPGTPTCAVVVTARNRLAGLVARHGAVRVDVDLLPPEDAVHLLRRLIGERVDADPAAAAELAERCARLPLALRVAAELVASHGTASLAATAAELGDEPSRLDLLAAGGDEYSAVRAVLSWSVRHLDAAASRAFEALGVYAGHDLDLATFAALADLDPRTARSAVGELVQAQLLQERTPGRYSRHDLLRLYAAELAEKWTAAERDDAAGRVADHVADVAAGADGDWLLAEVSNLVPVARAAVGVRPAAVVRLSRTLAALMATEAHFFDAVQLHLAAVAAAVEPGEKAAAHDRAARALYSIDRFAECLDQHRRALDLYRALADRAGEADTLQGIAWVLRRRAQCPEALEHLTAARAAHASIGDRAAEARDLSLIGVVLTQLGRYDEALASHTESLSLLHGLGNLDLECRSLNNLGTLLSRLERDDEAQETLERALALGRTLGSRVAVGIVSVNLADIAERQNRLDDAERLVEEAFAISNQLGRPVGRAECLRRLGRLAVRRGRSGEAPLLEALEIATAAEENELLTSVLFDLGEALLAGGDEEAAAARFSAALAVAERCGDPWEKSRAAEALSALGSGA